MLTNVSTAPVTHLVELPIPAELHEGRLYLCSRLYWQCISKAGAYLWRVLGTDELLVGTYDISDLQDGTVTAYKTTGELSGITTLYITGSGTVQAYTNNSTERVWGFDTLQRVCFMPSVGGSIAMRTYMFQNHTQLAIGEFHGSVQLAGAAFMNSGITKLVARDAVNAYNASSLCWGCLSLRSAELRNASSLQDTFAGCANLTELTLPDNLLILGAGVARSAALTSVYIPISVTDIPCKYSSETAASAVRAPFFGCPSTMRIYCGASSKPAGWSNYINYCAVNQTATIYWGYTREQYEEAIA